MPLGEGGSLSGSLVTLGSLSEAEQIQAQQEAKQSSSEAVVAREESQTKYENLNTEQATKVAGEAFPAVISEPAGGPPKLPAGESITGFPTDDAARVDLGDGSSGLIESLVPMAIEASGQRVPVDLTLAEAGGAFEPTTPITGVRIPGRLGEGVLEPSSGVRITPVSARGQVLSGSEGAIDGATVFFANTQTDSDTVVKPSTFGFAVDTLLRSVESPGQLFFRVGLPEGATLSQASDGSVEVLKEGVTIATVRAPSAWDAAGTVVPVSMSASGDLVTLSVPHSSNQIRYPIEVDPEFNFRTDTTLSTQTWKFLPHGSGFSSSEVYGGGLQIVAAAGTASASWGELYYKTKGVSRIYQVNTTTGIKPTQNGYYTAPTTIYLEFEGEKGYENRGTIVEYEQKIKEAGNENQLCASSCSPEAGSEHNLVRLVDTVTKEDPWSSSMLLEHATVSISQPKETHATASYNTTSLQVDGTTNVFHSGSWIGPNLGAFEYTAEDPGLGIAETRFEWYENGGWHVSEVGEEGVKKYLGTSACAGVQCAKGQGEALTYANLVHKMSLANGEDRIRVAADDPMEHTWSSEHGEGEMVLKVDHTPPHGLVVTGLPSKGEVFELGEVEAHIKAEASDGEGEVPSAGIKSLAVAVDGREIGKPSGSCSVSKGSCTASAEWSLNGAELGVGTHTLTLLATDNAGNLESKSYTLNVYHASPAAMGPGSVNPESGDFALGANDVGVSGGAGSLAVTRHYDSRNLREGEEGPLGPQWSLSLGSLASLEVLPDKSIMVVGPEGLTHFSVKSGGGFEAPKGDTTLTLEAKENGSKEVTEYLLKDSAKSTTTRFTLPSGATSWMPTVSEGPVATDTMTDTYQTVEAINEYPLNETGKPTAIAVGSDGNLWFNGGQEINKVPVSGTPVTTYSGKYSPESLALGPDGNVWFTSFSGGLDGIGKVTPSGGVTSYPLPEGTHMDDIAAGADGNMWFTVGKEERNASKIGKITPSGGITEYPLPEGSEPQGVTAGPDGDVWFADAFSGKIGKTTTAGGITEYKTGGAPWAIVAGPDGNLWYTDYTVGAIGKITTSGAVTEYALPKESNPRGITVGPDGNLWFTDYGTNKVGKITTAGSITEYSLPAESHPYGITAGPDGKLWFVEWGTNTSGTQKIATISTSGQITEPTLELAPHPSVACTPKKLAKGCRGLEFTYANETTAKGAAAETEWGQYRGRLMKVSFSAYNPASKEVESKPVAEYSYDIYGRLRAEWNPSISPALKTTYSYDPQGHVTALTPPGQESWAFTYGGIPTDVSTGRLLKATQAPAATELWNGEALKVTEAPAISGTPLVGLRMGVSDGKWSGGAVTYKYQWEDCSEAATECSPIAGATSENYTPVASDVGHKLVVQVTATGGGGATTAISTASGVVGQPSTKQSLGYEGPEFTAVACVPATSDCVIGDAYGNADYSTTVNLAAKTKWSGWSLGRSGKKAAGLACPSSSVCVMDADNTEGAAGNIYYATAFGGTWHEAASASDGPDAISCASTALCVSGDKEGYYRYSLEPASSNWSFQKPGSSNFTGVSCAVGKVIIEILGKEIEVEEPYCVMVDATGNVRVAIGKHKIEHSEWTTTDVDGTVALKGIACTSPTSCVAIDSKGYVLALTIESKGGATVSKKTYLGNERSRSLTAVTCTGSATCVTTDNEGDIYVSTNGGQTWAKEYTESDNLTSVSCASTALCVAADTKGNVVEFDPTAKGAAQAELYPPQPGSTIEYNVPLSGSGAPKQMTEGELKRWGQKDAPVYAAAVFPPDEPQSWPASDYKRARIAYMDSQARTVNVASPSGAVSTTEYNEEGQATRGLSPDNRATALKEECKTEKECKSAEVAALLDTKTAYNSEGQLTDTWGPQHLVKLVSGKEGKPEEVLARNHVKYHYDEGAPKGETYNLVTKAEDGAETATKEEFDKRTSTTSYSGQNNLGWKLREPTSATTDPSGLNLTSTTKYEEGTGHVIETQTPAANGEDKTLPPAFSAQFGKVGSEAGQVKEPTGTAIASNGNVYVLDSSNSRIDEFSPSGTFLQTFGWGVSDGKAEFETCKTNCKAGIAGTGNGQLKISRRANGRLEGQPMGGRHRQQSGAGVQLQKRMGIADRQRRHR